MHIIMGKVRYSCDETCGGVGVSRANIPPPKGRSLQKAQNLLELNKNLLITILMLKIEGGVGRRANIFHP